MLQNKNRMESKDLEKETLDLKTIIIGYLHQWKYFLAAFFISLIFAVLYLNVYPRTYEVFALIQLQEDKDLSAGGIGSSEASGLMKSFVLGGANGAGLNMDDERMVLASNELFREMILDLGINISYTKPYSLYKMYHDSPLRLKADSSTLMKVSDEMNISVVRKGSGNLEVMAKTEYGNKNFQLSALPAELDLFYGTFVLDYTAFGQELNKLDIKVLPVSWVAEDLEDGFLVEPPTKSSNVLEMSCRDHVKQRGIDKLVKLVYYYNQKADFQKKEEAYKTLSFLDERITAVMKDLSDIGFTIEEYKLRNRITALETDILFVAEQMKEIQTKIIEIEAQHQIINLIDSYVKDPENKYNLVPQILTQSSGEGASPLTSYNEALLERSRILQNSKGDNPVITKINNQVDQLRENVYLSIENAKKTLDFTLSDLRSKEKMLMDKLGEVPSQERVYIDYRRQQEIFQTVYLILLQKREETALSIGVDRPKARIIDAPYVKKKSVGPRKLYAGLFMIVFTFLMPILVLFIKKNTLELISAYKNTPKC